jgi:3',5'-cyclic AMP phosphodiesterase CpdA
VLIAQITDTHVTMRGAQASNLGSALAALAGLRPKPDVIVLTGDAVHRGLHAEYAMLRDVLARSSIPVYLVPGNHDRRSVLRAVLPDRYFPGVRGERLHFTLERGPVRLIGLDTTTPGRPGAFLGAPDIAWLDTALGAEPERPALIFMHHPPFRTGVRLADILGFAGLNALRATVGRHPAVQLLVAGHIHCERSAAFAHTRATTTLSTTPQHVPEVFERRIVGLRPEPAGFALHTWTGGGFVSRNYAADASGTFRQRA